MSISAFPHDGTAEKYPDYASPGMTLRDWFAGQALTGLLASGKLRLEAEGIGGEISKVAFEYADLMIEERSHD